MTHTPGPWTYDAEFEVIFGPSPDYDTVAATFFDRPEDECEANARLVAAAPQLLEALQSLLRDEKALDDDDPNLIKTREKARAAIAKATK
jgi:hypothetical protein